MEIQIEKGVPLPKAASRAGRPSKYPQLNIMEVGDSFFSKVKYPALWRQGRAVAKETGKKFTVRPETNDKGEVGSRIWRTA